ncbi:hypothetical protein LCGC14_2790140 [marine sediment metagenome]|uniref:Uncharacterized protein n=1 Tax=marine sediment metagenome TaxID=412755 RepID=A0A0F8YQS3_9ZZZZ
MNVELNKKTNGYYVLKSSDISEYCDAEQVARLNGIFHYVAICREYDGKGVEPIDEALNMGRNS